MRFETIATHVGGELDEETGAIAPPIHLSTTYELTADSRQYKGYRYSREANPTQSRLEKALTAMDSGGRSLVFSSGMAAGAAIAQSLPRGSRIVFTDDSYYAFRLLARDFLQTWGFRCDYASFSQPDSLREALREPATLLWAETPSNPLMNITDLALVARMAHDVGAKLLVDATFATPALQRPIEYGADIVLHSTTKYLGGHSDAGGGALIFARDDAFYEQVQHVRRVIGGAASPFNSWLVLRGVRTLPARMRVHSDNGRRVAEFLSTHPDVEIVHYPGLASHPGHEIAKKQMSDFGGMLSFEVKGGKERAIAVVAAVKIFVRATSLGGVESLMEHRWSTEGPGSTTPEALIRISVGLEHPDDLVEDLEQALEASR